MTKAFVEKYRRFVYSIIVHRKASDTASTISAVVNMEFTGETANDNSAESQGVLTKSSVAKKRFLDSMEMNYEKWHDGTGYDLSALDDMMQSDRDSIAEMLSNNLNEPWRSFEALAHINTPKALSVINRAMSHPSLEVRVAASRFAKGAERVRERVLVEALEKSDFDEGLSRALEQVEEFHPPGVIDALLRGLLNRGDSAAVNFAGMLLYIHGKADSSFDWQHRPLFLRFGTDNLNERKKAFAELCCIVGVDPKPYT